MRSAIGLLLRLGLGGVLAVAGILKLKDPAAFAVEVGNFQLFPAVAPFVAAVLPATELVVGAGLVILPRDWGRAAAAAALVLLVLFTVAVASAYFRHINIACGCFGAGQGAAIGASTLLRNLALLAAALVLTMVEAARAPSVGGSQNFT